MNKVNKTELSVALLEQAGLYLVILDERPMSGTERIAFKAWLLQSEQHKLAFEKVASTWGKMDVLQGLADMFPIEEPADPIPTNLDDQPYFSRFLKGALAASLLAVGVFIATSFEGPTALIEEKQNVAQQFEAEIHTGIGQIESVDMIDGSKILANTNSSLSVSITKTERRVVLDKGEAFFEVEHDPSRTFDVIVGDTIVRAIGTAFSVYRHGDEVKVIVTEGVVEVIKKPLDEEISGVKEIRERLHPRQVAEFGLDEIKIETIEREALARKLTWRQGMLAFEGEPLEQVLAEFSRYNQVKLEIAADAIREIRVGGYFNSNDVAGMLTALEGNFGVRVTYVTSDHIRLTSAQ